ncbi:MAG: hypothetical protein IJL32_00205 [Oscillospiraceae bacterium]|nr:hypothetical protein [Oscillospiraceae bacterium]
MEFKIKHISAYFSVAFVLPWIVFLIVLGFYLFFGITVQNDTAAIIMIGVILFCAAAELLTVILYIINLICGAKIIVESDHLDIRMPLRRRKIHFYDIEEVRYSHTETTESLPYHSSQHHHSLGGKYAHYFYNKRRHYQVCRAILDIWLTSGKCITLSDAATGYAQKRKRAMVDPSVNPDADVRLYQAYQCYCSAVDQYAVSHKFQIPR